MSLYWAYFCCDVIFICWPLQGYQLHRQATEERLNNSTNGMSFLARQRQINSRRTQSIPNSHTNSSRWNMWSSLMSCAIYLFILYYMSQRSYFVSPPYQSWRIGITIHPLFHTMWSHYSYPQLLFPCLM